MVTFVILLFYISIPATTGETLQKSTEDDGNVSVNEDNLEIILRKCGDYCERIKEMAFHFFCMEEISEWIYKYKEKEIELYLDPPYNRLPITVYGLNLNRIQKNSYLYDYQMLRDTKNTDPKGLVYINEQRILIKENGRTRNQKNAPLKTLRLQPKYGVFGPVGFLSRYWQKQFKYKIVGYGKLKQRSCTVVSASPIAPRIDNYSRALLWVDRMNFSILKIEWQPLNIKQFIDPQIDNSQTLQRVINSTLIYETEKNGVRFPTAHQIRESYMTTSGIEYPVYFASYRYYDYKFFVIGTKVTHQPVEDKK